MMALIEEKIREFGQKEETQELQDYIDDIPTDDLLSLVQDKLSNPNFKYTWNYILQGFGDTPHSHDKRCKAAVKVIEGLEKVEVSSTHSKDILTALCMELSKFKNNHLVELCDVCVNVLQSQKVQQMSWRELFPELINELSSRDEIEYNGEQLTGAEFKKQIVRSMGLVQWYPGNVIHITEMFTDITLSKEEHLQITNKLGTYFEKLTPQELPPFVYQFLKLCRHQNGRVIFFLLQEYFGPRTMKIRADQNSSDIDIIEDATNDDIIHAESTILYHIHSTISLEPDIVKDYLICLKNLSKSPKHILNPFCLSVLLMISTTEHEEKVFEIIRSSISRSYHEEQDQKRSAWFREIVGNHYSVEEIFSNVVEASAIDRDLIMQGLANFGFVLLGVGSALGRDQIAEKQWRLGSMIISKVVKRKRYSAPVILEELNNRILTNQSVTQYIECLYMLCKNMTLLMLENKQSFVLLIEGIVQMQGGTSQHILDAVIPLTKVSPTIRDHFIILLKKVVSENRQVALMGFLKLLNNLKISNVSSLSEHSFFGSYTSGHSIFTQLSMSSQSSPSSFSNEALCLEVLTILRRCFTQQAEVRFYLYEGLLEAILINPELGVPIIEILWLHFRNFYVLEEESLPPLNFDRISLTKDVTVVLQEPLGKLIYAIGLIVTTVAKTDRENPTVVELQKIFESLCTRMSQCELVHFELDDGTDLTDVLPESQSRLLVLKEAMSVYEALMAYKFYSWEFESENFGKQISGLFRAYSTLYNFQKNLNKAKKGDPKKKKDFDKVTQQTTMNSTLKKDGKKISKSKTMDSLLDFQVIIKVLSLLHESIVSWTTLSQSSVIKSKREFHQYIMQATLSLVTLTKNKKLLDGEAAKKRYDNLYGIAVILYNRIIKRLQDSIDYDCITACLAAEVFLMILNIIQTSYSSNLTSFLCQLSGLERAQDLSVYLTEFVETYQKLLEVDEEDVSQDPEVKKITVVIVNTLNFFLQRIPTTSSKLAAQVMEWSKNYITNNKMNNKAASTALINLIFDYHVKMKSTLSFFVDISIKLGDVTGVITEEEHNVAEFAMVNELTAYTVFSSLCSITKSILDDIDCVIAHLKSEHQVFTSFPHKTDYERRRAELSEKEKGVCCQLCLVVKILTNLSNCTIPVGSLSESVVKNLIMLYSSLTALTKYFTTRSSKTNPVFESVVKLAGKELAPVIYSYIIYIDESQTTTTSPNKKKKAASTSTVKNKLLKETRLFPKLVYEIEQFSKFVMQLSKKTDSDLSRLVGQGTVRDFRIKDLKKVLEKVTVGTQVTVTTQSTDSTMESVNDEEDEDTPPPSKRKKNTKN